MLDTRSSADYLDTFCPMHLRMNAAGRITHAGPTLEKLRSATLVGRRFLEVFELRRPRNISSVQDLSDVAGMKLHLKLRDKPRTELKGVLMPDPDSGGSIVNLSFGISIVDAVRDYDLSSADFALTDLTVEMLYLIEAKSAAMEASKKLNMRLQGAMIAAEEQAFTDTLTGLKNRRALDHVLERMLGASVPFALIQVDLDWFKAVNDTLGHAAGDHVLQKVAKVMVEETRDEDTVARIGGDEFVIVLPYATNEASIGRVGARIIERLVQPIPFAGKQCRISTSLGVAIHTPDAETGQDQLMDNADVALYASKRSGRARMTFYSEALRQDT